MKSLLLPIRHLPCPPTHPDNATAAAGPPIVRRIRPVGRHLLVFFILCGFIACGQPQKVAADSAGGIRADGRLDFINSEGRVLVSIAIEIADTPQARATGLMGRTGLNDSAGMFFVHDKAGPKNFWMRNTPTPLDIIFVSETGRVIHIAANTKPNSDTVYSSRGPARYVVEVLAGFCARHGVEKGTQISWKRK